MVGDAAKGWVLDCPLYRSTVALFPSRKPFAHCRVTMLKVASFNVENLFARAKAMNLDNWSDGKPVLNLFQSLNTLFQKPTYTSKDKRKILDYLRQLGLEKDDTGEFVVLRQNRGRLVKRPRNGPVQIVANGRHDWIGWLELRTEAVNEVATRNTAQVIRDINADVVGVVEAEDRISLKRFNEDVLTAVNGSPYEHVMLIDGNDDRGIDVGLLARDRIDILAIRSHVDDKRDGKTIFSRDCPEYELSSPSGFRLLLMVNHFKSKGSGGFAQSNAKRRRQAERVREIYDARRAEGVENIVILGDFNDTPGSDPLAPLLHAGSDLKDVSEHPAYESDGRPGTFGNGTASQKLDYILLPPALFNLVHRAGVFRKGVWGGKNGTLWEIYPEMKDPVHAASDHAALWVELNVS